MKATSGSLSSNLRNCQVIDSWGRANQTLLHIGCGAGRVSASLAQRFPRLTYISVEGNASLIGPWSCEYSLTLVYRGTLGRACFDGLKFGSGRLSLTRSLRFGALTPGIRFMLVRPPLLSNVSSN
jgi:hypothetical protein